MKKFWTKEDTKFLRDNYAATSNDELAQQLGRTLSAIRIKASKMGLSKPEFESFGMDASQRYRLKCLSEGKCPHCGKPCAPYKTCVDRREYMSKLRNKSAKRLVMPPKAREMTSNGVITRIGHVTAHRML